MNDLVPLPTPERLRAEVQAMVDLGARLTGSDPHDRFCAWVEGELTAAGLTLLPPDEYAYGRWAAELVALEVTDGDQPGPVDVAFAYVRSASTSAGGVTAPLVHLGAMPPAAPAAALSGGVGDRTTPAAIQSWAEDLEGDSIAGAIVVVDVALPTPLTAEIFVAVADYLHWPGHSVDDWAAIDYTRPWIGPWPELDVFAELGVAGVVLAADARHELLAGNYSPHVGRRQPVPAVVVGREAGAVLREVCGAGPATARLTLHAPTTPVRLRSVTATLPGESDEVLVVNSHSDGQNAFEENGTVALVALARHFASLPSHQRLHRTLVVAAWPGHMSGEEGIEDASCWVVAHPDLIGRAAAAVTIEHLGATEWTVTDTGYGPTGHPEPYGIWATRGPAAEAAKAALIDADLHRHSILKPPIQITPGRPLHDAGVPHVSGIAGPTYLLVVSDDGEMAKFDEHLGSRQITFFADVIRRLDTIPSADLRAIDPTLGANPPTYVDGRIK